MHTHIAYKISHDTITITVESDSPKPSSERVYQLAGKIFDKQFQERPTYHLSVIIEDRDELLVVLLPPSAASDSQSSTVQDGVEAVEPTKKKQSDQERIPQPLESPLRQNPARQVQTRQNQVHPNPLKRVPVLRRERLEQRLEESADDGAPVESLTTIANRRRAEALAAAAERERRRLQLKNDMLLALRAEKAKRLAYYKVNPFAEVDAPKPKPREQQGLLRRRKCSYCNFGAAIVRQRILWQQQYEFLDLCYLCEMKRQRGLILLDDEQWDSVHSSSEEEEGDQEAAPVQEEAAVAAAPAGQTWHQARLPLTISIRSVGSRLCGFVWAKNPVRQLVAKAVSLDLLRLVQSFVTDEIWQPVAALVADTALRAREIRRASRRQPNLPHTDVTWRSGQSSTLTSSTLASSPSVTEH
ncbi:MAG: hypothetical protein STHCBS139747_005459 [Sporothrix thermara]